MFMYVATLVVVLLSIFGFAQSWPPAEMIVNTGPLVPIFEIPSSPFLASSGKYPNPRRGNETELVRENVMQELQETYSEHADNNNTTEIARKKSYIETIQMPSSQFENKLQNVLTGEESIWLSTIEANTKQILKELINQHSTGITNSSVSSTSNYIVTFPIQNDSKIESFKESDEFSNVD